MRILAIGNSFSQDAMRYLYGIARSDGKDIETVNLYVPACTLEMHYRYMLSGERAYGLQYNGLPTGFNMSLKEALLSRQWDVITIQQQSIRSSKWDSFEPFVSELYAYVKKCAPTAKILIHQIWPVEDGSERLTVVAGYSTAKEMFVDIEDAYNRCHALLGNDGIIPSGALMMKLLDRGIEKVHRDTLHVTKGLGRYALGLLWYRCLTGKSVADISYADFDEPVTEEEIRIAKECVDSFPTVL